jgi:hypothetical protein
MSTTYNLRCERCGSAFTSDQPDARFCSKLCHALVGHDKKFQPTQYLDNHCTIRVSVLTEAHAMLNSSRKGK